MTLQALDYIFETMATYFGLETFVWLSLAFGVFAIFLSLLRMPIGITIMTVSTPFILMSFYNLIYLGWVWTIVAFIGALIIAITYNQIFNK